MIKVKPHFTRDMSLEDYLFYNEAFGMSVDINDGQVTNVYFEEAEDNA